MFALTVIVPLQVPPWGPGVSIGGTSLKVGFTSVPDPPPGTAPVLQPASVAVATKTTKTPLRPITSPPRRARIMFLTPGDLNEQFGRISGEPTGLDRGSAGKIRTAHNTSESAFVPFPFRKPRRRATCPYSPTSR